MIKSMTAFSRAETEKNNIMVMIEIRTYNSRYLDIVLHLPHEYLSFEEKIRSVLAKRISRGRVTVHFEIKKEVDQAPTFDIDIARATAYHDALSRLKTALNIEHEISLDLILDGGDMIKPREVGTDMALMEDVILTCLNQAVDDLDAMRIREGDFLSKDLQQRLEFLEACIGEIESASMGLIEHYQAQLIERIERLTKGTLELDSDRVVQEAAFLADKSDISEEIVRVRSHIKQFQALINDDEPAGRKLNFLLQEFNREFNTIGSKTGNASVPYRIVEAKAEIEKMREQVQNVE